MKIGKSWAKWLGISIERNRAAWGWTAKMHVYDRHSHKNETHDIKVYYSIYHYDTDDAVTVPLRFEIFVSYWLKWWHLIGWLRLEVMFEDGSRLVNEIFNFRVNTIPDEIFNTPELAPCKVRNYFLYESKINGHQSKSTARNQDVGGH